MRSWIRLFPAPVWALALPLLASAAQDGTAPLSESPPGAGAIAAGPENFAAPAEPAVPISRELQWQIVENFSAERCDL
ncbi:MAG: hypothetical protein ACXVA8_13740, partial [Bdellovibrionota bacterium]